jgi:hypothetical protein
VEEETMRSRLVPLLGFGVAMLLGGACGDSDPAGSADPGRPNTEYGTKMGGPVRLSASETTQVFGTAAAVSRDGRTQLFLIPHMAATPAFQRAYLSIWWPGTSWPNLVTEATTGVGAKIEFVALDGRAFALDTSTAAPPGALRLEIDRAEPSADGTHQYLTGKLQATLTGAQGAAVTADFRINVP